MMSTKSKLQLEGKRIAISDKEVLTKLFRVFQSVGCSHHVANVVAEHLVNSSLSGVESHGVMRVLQYVEQYRSGYLKADVEPVFIEHHSGVREVDGKGGIGIPAMWLAVEKNVQRAKQEGIAAIAVRNAGHTGRLGAYAEKAAEDGCLTIMLGGGNRKTWRQVAPYGGRKALLPTNPYCIGIPGGERGPVVLDFATSKIAGGWIYAARSAGATLPEGTVIDKEGNVTVDPEDYFSGGAILPSGEAKGYALGLMAELIAEAMLGPAKLDANVLMITLDTSRYSEPSRLSLVAEEILAEMRDCTTAPGFETVQIPGEREREQLALSDGKIAIPEQTWQQICELLSSIMD